MVTELEIPHTAVLAGTWKSTLGIKGKNRVEQKRNAKAFVNEKYNIKATQDEADAICIGTHMLTKPKAKIVKDLKEALAKISSNAHQGLQSTKNVSSMTAYYNGQLAVVALIADVIYRGEHDEN